MQLNRPYVLSIAGFDPTAGAGVLADIKCFEQHRVYGFGVCSALTVQTDADFISCQWMDANAILAQLDPLFAKFNIAACKIGLIKDSAVLLEVMEFIKYKDQRVNIILDPVLKASSGFEFHEWDIGQLIPVLDHLDLITPNYQEMLHMGDGLNASETAAAWSVHCPVLLKGGHNTSDPGTDFLFDVHQLTTFRSGTGTTHQKHGSGCTLSAAITANLALGHDLVWSCRLAKSYTEHFLNSNQTLLGYHNYD